ncbi:MAG: hypothetical protein K6U00_08070 [Armatimonadetes bacterium]|nr:hypothetical protein [Armatimonadota bacterium]
MIEEQHYVGLWWLPDSPDKKVSGSLKIIPGERLILALNGSLTDTESLVKPLGIVQGEVQLGQKVTLYGCEVSGIK